MLAFEVEYLAGTVIAAQSPDDDAVDWPPQPDRVFSALVASWGARGGRPEERAALEWLERQPAPRILASPIEMRTSAISFVPPNDFKTSAAGFDVIPSRRMRQPRRFPTGRPHDPVVRLFWPGDTPSETRQVLDALARDTSYIGHSSSLTRCRFLEAEAEADVGDETHRGVYPGRLAELEMRFREGRRPRAGVSVSAAPPLPRVASSVFSRDWIVLADDGGTAPDMRAFPLIAKKMRDALTDAYAHVAGPIPSWLSGLEPDGTPARGPHLAVVPLLDVAWKHSQGRLLGCALVLPSAIDSGALVPAVAELVRSAERGRDSIELHWGSERWQVWQLSPTDRPALASQKPDRWTGRARLWTTATPIALDRFPKANDDEARRAELADIVGRACENIGLPRPTHVEVSIASPLSGTVAARISRQARPWEHWQLPPKLVSRALLHATVGFEHTIEGPIVLGAGRFVGLGLCLPVMEEVSRG